ncbi:hypothetical protein H4R34_000321 [Dimargaris verticillata]|uniref:RING-type domain-containing protein n=1 Tax=Dimargaris verticillata TaxID=2761393 RepID=A0A9W8EET8_9FUNG|nr:hypothetical protein H4R34_000321 [Dimargaris verticillata]
MDSHNAPKRPNGSLSPPVGTDRAALRIDTAANQLHELPTLAPDTLSDPALAPRSSRTAENQPTATTAHPTQSRHRGSPVPSARFQPYLATVATAATPLRSPGQRSPNGRDRIARLMTELCSPSATRPKPARTLSSGSTARRSPTNADSATSYLQGIMSAVESPVEVDSDDAQPTPSDISAVFPVAGPSPTANTPLGPSDTASMALLPTALNPRAASSRSPCTSEPLAGPGASTSPGMASAPDVDLSCPICLQTITEAFMTRCGHSFCYQCISAHLEHQGNCPSCRSTLTREQIYPNFILNQILEKRSLAFSALANYHTQGLPQLQAAIASQPHLQLHDIDQLLGVLLKRRQRLESHEKRFELEILLGFLHKAKAFKRAILGQLQRELACVEDDIADTQQELVQLSHDHASPLPEPSVISADGACVPVAASELDHRSPLAQPCLDSNSNSSSMATSPITAIQPALPVIAQRIDAHFKDLQQCYFDHRLKAPLGNADLSDFVATLGTCTRYRLFRPVATLRYGDAYNSSSIVASIEFDRDDEYFATAGVTRKIKIFEFGQIQAKIDAMEQLESRQLVDDYCELLNASASTSPRQGPAGSVRGPVALPWTRAGDSASADTPFQYYPTREMVCRNKISCLSWNPYIKSQIANSDYEGVVTLWDAQVGVQMATFTEHDKRAWSVDFSRADPTRLASGSDDARVKIWSTGRKQSVMTLESKANICCVKFHPHSSHHLAFGSADHHIYYYDLRQPRHPLCLFKGHRKAVSYVKFLNDRELVSASTDSTLKLWDVQQAMADTPMDPSTPGSTQLSPPATTRCRRTFSGHTNEKNFVGLSVNQDWISCGSENNCAYTYYKSLSQPMFSVKFGMVNPTTGEAMAEKDSSLFVSSVCWKKNTNVLMAANSQGTVKVLQLV